MRFEGYVTSLTIHSSTRNRLRDIIDSTNFSSYEELINYLIDRYVEEENEKEYTSNENEDIE